MEKIKLAFIQYAGLAAGGTEKALMTLAGNLNKDDFQVDYYWCQPGRDLYTGFKHSRASETWKTFMEERGVKTIEFTVKERDISESSHKWIDTNFWEIFDYKNYDIIQTCKAGHPEYPFTLIPKPIVEWNVFGSVDFSPNIYTTLGFSHYISDIWESNGGDVKKGGMIYPGLLESVYPGACERPMEHKKELVLGFHQGSTDAVFSPIPIQAFAAAQSIVKDRKLKFIMLGGSKRHREQAKNLGLSDIEFLPINGNWQAVCEYLLSLDIFTHGRFDGECHGTCIQEAMLHGLPVLSHLAYMNGQVEIIGDGGKVLDGLDEYIKYLLEVVNSDELRVSLGKKALAIARRDYLASKNALKFEDLYRKILEDKAGVAACSLPIPEGGYKNPPLAVMAFRRFKYGFSHPKTLGHIVKRTWAALFGRGRVQIKKLFHLVD